MSIEEITQESTSEEVMIDAWGEDFSDDTFAEFGEGDFYQEEPSEEEAEEVFDEDMDEEEVEESTEEVDSAEVEHPTEDTGFTATITVNGMEMTVNSIEEAQMLMQKGAEATQQVEAMKPQRKVISMLEKQGLMDEGKLNHLIDIYQKKPEAIAKFIKDSGIDLMDVDEELADQYKPTDYSVTDAEVNLNDVLNEIKATETGSTTLDSIQKWDGSSLDHLVQNPHVLKVINTHVQEGVFGKVMTEIAKRKIFGSIPAGTTDIALYYEVGKEMADKGLFNKEEPPVVKQEVKDTSQELARRKAKQSVKPPKQTAPVQAYEDDVDAMSDAELMAWVSSQR